MPPSKRKAQLVDLARKRRERREQAAEELDKDFELDGDNAAEAEEMEVVAPGDAARREDQASRQRLHRERLRGLGPQSQAMRAWLGIAIPSDAAREAAAMTAAKELAAAQAKEEAAAQARARMAAHRKEQRERAEAVIPRSGEKRCRVREGRTFDALTSSAASICKRRAAFFISAAHIRQLGRMHKKRRIDKDDFLRGEQMSKVEFSRARRDYKELQRVTAMHLYIRSRKEGKASRDAYQAAAMSFIRPNGKHINWQTVRLWMAAFVQAGGKVSLSQTGRTPATCSYLSDPNLKDQALAWVREQLRLARAKNTDAPPLTVKGFQKWINSTLLKPRRDANPRLKPICRTTTRKWLEALGFTYKAHTKSLYYDGHEREDVVRDRMEKLAMLKALEEVTVTFFGRNCEETRWPLLHPGEPPLVWVSQDESAYHSNDDVKSEWAEQGKGLSIKQKSRGSLLMVSMFVSELRGILRANKEELAAYAEAHPSSQVAAKLAAQPTWDGSSTLILEPGAAPGKDKYFDAEQLLEQTKLAQEIFEATHFAPGRWVFHPSSQRFASPATYPQSFTSVWLPPTRCKPLFFYDHSSGHGAYAMDALLANRPNKGPDWKGSVHAMRDGFFHDANGVRQAQCMQFQQGDILRRDITCPPGVDPNAAPRTNAPSLAGTPADASPPLPPPLQPPPTEGESAAALKLFLAGCQGTLKKHNPGKSNADLRLLGEAKWAELSLVKRRVFVGRVRAKASAGPAAAKEERVIKAGQPVPQLLWGRNKGTEAMLDERGLYPSSGLRGDCASKHASGDVACCCVKVLSTQQDFVRECSALQHLVEERVVVDEISKARGCCLFLPKFHCELNWIERFWGASKAYTRKHCLYTLPGLRETVPFSLSQDLNEIPADRSGQEDLPVAPLYLQRRWARVSRQYMHEYWKGADACDAIKLVAAQRTTRHRDTSDGRSRAVEAAMAARVVGN